VARAPPSGRAVSTRSARGRKVAFSFHRFHLQEVAMKTDITSASTAMPSRFSKVLGH